MLASGAQIAMLKVEFKAEEIRVVIRRAIV